MARSRAAFGAIAWWLRSISAIWNPTVYTGFSAVIGSWKITETSTPADRTQRSLIDADELAVAELDRAGDVRVLRQQPEQRHRDRRLAGTGLADDRQHLAGGRARTTHRPPPDTSVPSTQKSTSRLRHREVPDADSAIVTVRRFLGEFRRCARWATVRMQRRCARCSGRGSAVCCASASLPSAPCRWWHLSRRDGPSALWRAGPWLALVAGSCWALFWRPEVVVDDGGVRLVNVFRTIDVPWPSIQAVDTKWALTLITAYGRFTGWAAPAPGMHEAVRAHRAATPSISRTARGRARASGPATCRRARRAARRC